jgi:uncharacterized protein YjbJ (UPF0337 family)
MSTKDKLTGRVKKAAGDLSDNDKLKREGQVEEGKGKTKEKLDDAVDKVADMGRDR